MERADRLRMRRGKLTIEARLDLHGMTRDQAHGALIDFLDRARERGRRTVLVITGKGSGPGSPRGILREAVPRWLNETPARTWIKGFGYAAPADGGEGALYVLLKRKRS